MIQRPAIRICCCFIFCKREEMTQTRSCTTPKNSWAQPAFKQVLSHKLLWACSYSVNVCPCKISICRSGFNRNWPLAQNILCRNMKTGCVYCSKSISQNTFFQHFTCVSYTSILLIINNNNIVKLFYQWHNKWDFP